VLGARLEGLPIADAVETDQGLGDGVLLDVQRQAGDPLDEALLAAAGEADGHGQDDGLPKGPQPGSLHRAPPGLNVDGGRTRQSQPGRCSCPSLPLRRYSRGDSLEVTGCQRNQWLAQPTWIRISA